MNKLDRDIQEGTQTNLEDYKYRYRFMPIQKKKRKGPKRFMIFTTARGLVAEELTQ